jgi:hypothetical protein
MEDEPSIDLITEFPATWGPKRDLSFFDGDDDEDEEDEDPMDTEDDGSDTMTSQEAILPEIEDILVAQRIDPARWPMDASAREAYDPFPANPLYVRQNIVPRLMALVDRYVGRMGKADERLLPVSLFIKAFVTLDCDILNAILPNMEHGLRFSMVDLAQLLGLPYGQGKAAFLAAVVALPQSVYHAATNAILTCARFPHTMELDAHMLPFLAGNPACTERLKIEIPDKDPLGRELFFAVSTKIAFAHLADALQRTTPPTATTARTIYIYEKIADLYLAWITGHASPLRAARDLTHSEPYIAELVEVMRNRFTFSAILSLDIARKLSYEFSAWIHGGAKSPFWLTMAGVSVRAQVHPSFAVGQVHATFGSIPVLQNDSILGLRPHDSVLVIEGFHVPPWFDAAEIYHALFASVEQGLTGAFPLVSTAIVGPVLAPLFHVLDQRCGWSRTTSIRTVYDVCPPRPGDLNRAGCDEYFYWSVPVDRFMLLLSRSYARLPLKMGWKKLMEEKILTLSALEGLLRQLNQRLCARLNGPLSEECSTQGFSTRLSGSLNGDALVLRQLLVTDNAPTFVLVVTRALMVFLVNTCRVLGLSIVVEGSALTLLGKDLLSGDLWTSAVEYPWPRFKPVGSASTSSCTWVPLLREPTAVRPEPLPGYPTILGQRLADLKNPPRAVVPAVYEGF